MFLPSMPPLSMPPPLVRRKYKTEFSKGGIGYSVTLLFYEKPQRYAPPLVRRKYKTEFSKGGIGYSVTLFTLCKTGYRMAARFAIVCFMKMNAPITQSFCLDKREIVATQDVVYRLPCMYIIQLKGRFFKYKKAVLSHLYRGNDVLHNNSLVNLCIIFLIITG